MQSGFSNDLITGLLSFIFTVFILSYLVADTPAFRLAIHAFVGVSAGYIVITVFRQVIVDKLLVPFMTGTIVERILLLFPIVMSILLLFTASDRFEGFGRPVVALLVGVGTAVAISGAILGTIFPQFLAVIEMFDLRRVNVLANSSGVAESLRVNVVTAFFAILGTISTLAYFQFTRTNTTPTPPSEAAYGSEMFHGHSPDVHVGYHTVSITEKKGWSLDYFGIIGKVFIAITMAAIFSGVLLAALTAFVDRVQSLLIFVSKILSNFNY